MCQGKQPPSSHHRCIHHHWQQLTASSKYSSKTKAQRQEEEAGATDRSVEVVIVIIFPKSCGFGLQQAGLWSLYPEEVLPPGPHSFNTCSPARAHCNDGWSYDERLRSQSRCFSMAVLGSMMIDRFRTVTRIRAAGQDYWLTSQQREAVSRQVSASQGSEGDQLFQGTAPALARKRHASERHGSEVALDSQRSGSEVVADIY